MPEMSSNISQRIYIDISDVSQAFQQASHGCFFFFPYRRKKESTAGRYYLGDLFPRPRSITPLRIQYKSKLSKGQSPREEYQNDREG